MHPSIEPLEARIAPASFTYVDIDGDRVKIVTTFPDSLGTTPELLNVGEEVFLSSGSRTTPGQLQELKLTDSDFAGATIKFSVQQVGSGDGFADVGFLNATNVDLLKATIRGDLGRVAAGDGTSTTPAFGTFKTQSIGVKGLVTQAEGGNLESVLSGNVGKFKTAGDIANAVVKINGAVRLVDIKGSVRGGAEANSGSISFERGKIEVAGDVIGGAGAESGWIMAPAQSKIFVEGAVRGGTGPDSGRILAEEPARLRVGSVIGGAGARSGQISAQIIEELIVTGSITGGSGPGSGAIAGADGDIASIESVTIGKNLQGGSALATGVIYAINIGKVDINGSILGGKSSESGVIRSVQDIASVAVQGSIRSGTGATLQGSGAIVAGEVLGSVIVGRDLFGNSVNPVLIVAGANPDAQETIDLAISNVTVGGDVRFSQILAGFELPSDGSTAPVPADADASIGTIAVRSDWLASSAVAGAVDFGAPGWGSGDFLQGGENSALIAQIKSIAIDGRVSGTIASGDHYGFVAQQLLRITIGDSRLRLANGPSNDSINLVRTNDVRALEVAPLIIFPT